MTFFRVIDWLGPTLEKLELYHLMSLNRAAREGCSSGKQYAWFGDGRPEVGLEEVLFATIHASCPRLKTLGFWPGSPSWYDAAFKAPIMPGLEELPGCVSVFLPNEETYYAATPRMLQWLATQPSLARLSVTLPRLDAAPNGINVQNETPSQQYVYYNTGSPVVGTKPPPIDLTVAEVFCPPLEELETHSPTFSDLSKFLELSTASKDQSAEGERGRGETGRCPQFGWRLA